MRVVPALVAAALLATGCSALQESLECPGEHCPDALQAVADDTARLPGVTSVDRTWRFYNLDHGNSGGVDLHATVAGESDARALAEQVFPLYEESEVEPVDHLSVLVVPDPERAEPDVDRVSTGSPELDRDNVPCAADGCATEVAAFEDAFAADLAQEANLVSATWVGEVGHPHTTLRVTAPDETMDHDAIAAFQHRVLDVAEEAGLMKIGVVETIIRYRSRVEFSFSKNVKTGKVGAN